MAGNVTGFQLTYLFKASETYPKVGMQQAVSMVANSPRYVEVPAADNAVVAGVVTYQEEDRDGFPVAVQLDRVAEVEAAEDVAWGDELIIAAGGKVKKASGVASGNVNVLGVAQDTVKKGERVPVLIRPYIKAAAAGSK